jgi:ketosteroid isomerase-like protein
MATLEEEIREFGRRWAEAEERGDVPALGEMADEDLTLVGPLGFVLDKAQWLDRYGSGSLVTKSLSWDDVTVRSYGDTAVAVGVHTQRAAYRGQPSDGRFRATHVLVRSSGGWRLASIHLSPIAGPPIS